MAGLGENMRREQLEHLIRAASAVTNCYELVVVGSQSILGAYPNAPEDLLYSQEADMFPLEAPLLSDLIDGALGEDSPFHGHFGYYAQGVGENTAVLPAGWRERLVRIQSANTDLRVGLCLEPHDLAASKLYAGRPKDIDFVRSLLDHGLVDSGILQDRLRMLNGDATKLSLAASRLAGLMGSKAPEPGEVGSPSPSPLPERGG
jgi:hypothetical protein